MKIVLILSNCLETTGYAWFQRNDFPLQKLSIRLCDDPKPFNGNKQKVASYIRRHNTQEYHLEGKIFDYLYTKANFNCFCFVLFNHVV